MFAAGMVEVLVCCLSLYTDYLGAGEEAQAAADTSMVPLGEMVILALTELLTTSAQVKEASPTQLQSSPECGCVPGAGRGGPGREAGAPPGDQGDRPRPPAAAGGGRGRRGR